MDRLDFVTTNFGFGPVAKLVAVARAIRSLSPGLHLRLIASDHALAFGRMSGAFDEHVEADLDRSPEQAASATEGARAIVDSLNFDVIPPLAFCQRRVFLLDSLAWLWPHLPAGVEKAFVYGVQGYLLDSRPDRERELPRNSLRLRPILDPEIQRLARDVAREPDLALINLGGCCNPFVPPRDLAQYAVELVRASLRPLRSRFSRIEVHTNANLAAVIQEAVGNGAVTVRHSSHRDFLDSLARCGLLLTTPGITATLEAIALGTPIKFLPPSNYSQYRILEIYHQRRVLSADVRLSAFPWGVEVGPDEQEEEAVRRIGGALAAIRPGEVEPELDGRLEGSLGVSWSSELDRLRGREFTAGNGALDLAQYLVETCGLAASPPPPPPLEATVMRLVGDAAGIPASALRGETRLEEDLGIHSMGVLELVAMLEGALGFSFGSGEVDITDFRTIDRIVAAVSRRLPHGTTA